MGGGFAGRAARQHSDLTLSPDDRRALRAVLLTLLAVDGIISALLFAFFLPLSIGPVPFPISALISGLLNAALVWAGLQWTSSLPLAGLPLWTWLATVAGLSLGGPGNDIIFGGAGVMAYAPLLFIALGALPPVILLRRSRSA
jgi:hypothetical protein